MMLLYIILCALFGIGDLPSNEIPIRLEMLDGRTRDVRVTQISSDGFLYFESSRERVALDSLATLSPTTSAARPAAGGPQTFYLADGGQISGKLVDLPSADARKIRIDLGLASPIDIPLDALKSVRFGSQENGAAEHELEARLANRATDKDFLLVIQDEKAVVLPGALDRLTPQGWEFTIGHKTQKQPLDAAYAVILGGSSAAMDSKVRGAQVQLRPEGVLAGRIISADGREVQLELSGIGKMSIPWDRIGSIGLHSSRTVFLSDQKPSGVKASSALDIDFPPRMNTAVTGAPMTLHGLTYAKGIGVHARTALEFKIDGQYERLLTTVGVDDESAPIASVVFRVLGD